MQRLTLVLAMTVAACGGPKTAPHGGGTTIGNTADSGATVGPHEVIATLERTACYGSCPIYTVTVYRDGTVEFSGEQYVKTRGTATGQIGPDAIAQLDQLFTAAHYFELKDAYTDYDVTDNPSAKTSYSAGGKTKSIDHYYGDSDAPAVLQTIEDGIDGIVHIETWIGTEAEREQNHYYQQ